MQMALPFTNEQRDSIRARLILSAQRHALKTGLKKTSLDMLTSDAGISKSSFYKFYDSKEMLFLEVAGRWEQQLLATARLALTEHPERSDKERAAAMVLSVFREIHEMGIARFLREDLPQLTLCIPRALAREHYMSSAEMILASLREAEIRFTAPDEVILSVIQLLYLSILNIAELGDSFFPALHEVVAGACDRLVA